MNNTLAVFANFEIRRMYSEVVTKCNQLKMIAQDGKLRLSPEGGEP